MRTITLDAKDLMAGESNWDYLSDKGFSPDSYGLNLFLKPGVLNFGWTNTDRGGATLTGNPVAYAYDKNNNGNDLYIVDDTGCFYTLNGATFTKRVTLANSAGFQLGTTDFTQFKGNTYASYNGASTGIVAQLQGSDLTSGTLPDWMTGLNVNVRHPLEVVEDKMYIGDLNLIHAFDGTTTTMSAITLPSDANITSLRRHPDGRHLIAFTGYQQNYSHTNGGPGKIYIINKDTLQWEREILIDTQVEGSRNVGGVIYVTYGKKLGYFTGSGVKFLKQLKTSSTTYSHSMGNMEDFLLVRDGTNALAYGDLGNGVKSWHNFYNGSTINIVAYKGQNKVVLGTAAASLLELDYATASGNGRFVTNRYNFGSTVKVRRIEFIHDAKLTGSILNTSIFVRDTDDNTNLISMIYPAGPTPNKTRVETDIMVDIFQFIIQPSNGVFPTKLIRIYYEPIP